MRLDIRATIEEHLVRKIKERADKAAFKNFGHAAATVRRTAQKSIERAPKARTTGRRRRRAGRLRRTEAGPKGKPIRTRRGQAPRSIVFDANERGAIIGPRFSFMGESFAAHEFGEELRGIDYPERPTMGPALEENVGRFANEWEDSIGE